MTKEADTAFDPPGDPRYDAARATYNLAVDLRPAGAVVARTADDVSRAVRAARRAGLPVRVQTTGHGAGGQAAIDAAVLVRTALTDPVRVDPVRRTALVPAGATWAEVVAAAAPHGLIAPHGSSPTVGVVGYLLGGGIGFYGRRFGLGANSLRSVIVVLADGNEVVAGEDSEPELFWALRGGGGGFGIVTEVEIDLFPMAAVITGALFWEATDAAAVAPLWEEWTHDAPTAAATSLRLMNLPPLPGIPPVITGRQVLVLDGAVLVEQATDLDSATRVADDLLKPLRAAATPLLDTWRQAAPTELPLTHMDPPDPLPYIGEHALLSTLGKDGLQQFMQAAGPGSGTVLVSAELRQLGGAFAEPARAGGAFDRTEAAHAYLSLGVPVPPVVDQVREDLLRIAAATAPWRTGLTAPTLVEGYGQQQRTFDDATAARVAAVRAAVDPDGVFAGGIAPIHNHAGTA